MTNPISPYNDGSILVAIPALNEAEKIADVVAGIHEAFASLKHEILVVDDGSIDDTGSIAKAFGCLVIRHEANFGVGIAFRSAANFAREQGFSGLATIDADDQFDSRDLLNLVQVGLDNPSVGVVSGTRFDSRQSSKRVPWLKRFGNRVLAGLISLLTGQPISDSSCGLRYYSRAGLSFVHLRGSFTYTQETIMDIAFRGLSIKQVPITVQYFADRKSRVAGNLLNYALRASAIIVKAARDYFPMKVFGSVAIAAATIALIFSSLFVSHFLTTGMFSGYLFAGLLGAFFWLVAITSFGVGLIIDSLCSIRLAMAQE
jgi:glycosyltransferase involved in cell wall biosynthesis